MTERCERSDLPVDTCAHCTGRDGGESAEAARRKRLLDSGQAFSAQYAGLCAGCGEHFAVGEPIQRMPGGEPGQWSAPCCIIERGTRAD